MDQINELLLQSRNKPWLSLLEKYLNNTSLFFNEYTINAYMNEENEARRAIQKIQSVLEDTDTTYVFDVIDFHCTTCFEWFKAKYLEFDDIQFRANKAEDRYTWNNIKPYEWEK